MPRLRRGSRTARIEFPGVKLPFDENLSPKLVRMLADDYPGCLHIREAGHRGASDADIWEYARRQGFTIVSKNTDFRERSFVEGSPPKVIWLDIGNGGTTVVAELLWRERRRVEAFHRQDESSFLILSLGPPTV